MTRKVNTAEESDTNSSFNDSKSRIKKFAKSMLRNTLFVGEFEEKRFVASLTAYRDVIKISDDEQKFIENLKVVKEKLIYEYSFPKIWIGITDPNTIGTPNGHCLWVKLKKEIFGKYWFNVKSVEFQDNEIRLKLNIIRPFESSYKRESIHSHEQSTENILNYGLPWGYSQLEKIKETIFQFAHDHITVENVTGAIKFLTITHITFFFFFMEFFKWLLEYLLKFMREFTGIVKAVTPIFQTLLKALTQVIMALLFWLYCIFKGSPPPQGTPIRPSFKRLPSNRYRPAIEYPINNPPYYVTEPPY